MKEFTRIQLKMERFRRTVELDRAGKLPRGVYENERKLTVFAFHLGEEVLSYTPDQALEQAVRCWPNSEIQQMWVNLAECLERRQVYKARAF